MPKTCAVCGSSPTLRQVGKRLFCGKKKCLAQAWIEQAKNNKH